MIGFDTNILLRLYETEDDPAQAIAAQRALKEHTPVFINPIVLIEFAWTLRRAFKLSRAGVHARLAQVIESSDFQFVFPRQTRDALESFRIGSADFADYFVAELNLALGCDATLTFDKTAAKNRAFRYLSA
jgi:predicted nucleic-acid-binding protein